MTSTVTLEQNRNLIAKVETKVAGASSSGDAIISSYTYTNDQIARRTAMTKSGTAVSTPDTISYAYNTRSEVTGAVSNVNPAYAYQYQFDNIGNRITSTESGVNKSYTANNLNQYTSISSAQSAETPTLDADGNQLELINSKGSWNLSYNAENRPVVMVSNDTRIENTYDYMGRRVEKKVFQSGSGVPPLLTSHSRFVYDGYLQIQELNARDSNEVTKSYAWDPTAGQATRPLVMTVAPTAQDPLPTAYYYTFDANKNITELVDAQSAIVAHYEYGPFGQTTIKSGDLADENPFCFSAEFHDDECGLVYYNYRHYNPKDGRWINRDPIGEKGGFGIYSMIKNKIINYNDFLGLTSVIIIPPSNDFKWRCCRGKSFLPAFECCIKGAIISRFTEVTTGVIIYESHISKDPLGIPREWCPNHTWLRTRTGKVLETLGDNIKGGRGLGLGAVTEIVDSESVKLSPCEYDFNKFNEHLEKIWSEYDNGTRTWYYNPIIDYPFGFGGNCDDLVTEAITEAKIASKRISDDSCPIK